MVVHVCSGFVEYHNVNVTFLLRNIVKVMIKNATNNLKGYKSNDYGPRSPLHIGATVGCTVDCSVVVKRE